MIKKLLTFILSQCVMSVAFAVNYLTFTAEEAGSKFGIYNSEDNDPEVLYSLDDGATWTKLEPGERVELKNVGDKALLKGYNPDGFSMSFAHNGEYFYDYTEFRMSGKIAASPIPGLGFLGKRVNHTVGKGKIGLYLSVGLTDLAA